MPTHAECAGIVFCESSAYGLPSLAYQMGGISSLIKDNVTGKLFSLEDTSMEKWVKWIKNDKPSGWI
ncbi:MAG: glycosyltransferase [Selenomonadaceae bacterium]|nr:glycosyltransferase [Selenomonadaceae bacterium]